MGRYCIYLDENLEKKLDTYMKKNNYAKRSVAIKDCITKVILDEERQSLMFEINDKLNRILYRQNLNKIVQEQMFANFGFPLNYDVKEDKLLKEIYVKNDKYTGRFD